jgi:hypothetical protein
MFQYTREEQMVSTIKYKVGQNDIIRAQSTLGLYGDIGENLNDGKF